MAKWFGVNPSNVAGWSIVEYAECLAYRDLLASPEDYSTEEVWQGRDG